MSAKPITGRSLQAAGAEPAPICFVTETYPPEVNGVARTLKRWIAGLRGRGFPIQLVRPRQGTSDDHPASDGDFQETLEIGVPIPFYSDLRFGLPTFGTLERLWRRRRPSVVYIATEGPLGMAALDVARRLGIPAVTGFHTNFHAYASHYQLGFLKKPVLDFLRHFHNRSRATLVPTEELKQHLEQVGYRNVHVIARGVDTEHFSPQRRSSALRECWGLKEDDLAVIHVGRVAPEKNMDLVVKSFREIQKQRPEARLILVGDGPMRRPLAEANPDLILTGTLYEPEIWEHYASADLFLFPSETETFGNVILEAMASGLALVAYDYAAAHQHIRDGENGRLAPLGGSEEFKRAAVELAQEQSSLIQIRQGARQAALGADWQCIYDQLLELFQRHAQEEHLPESESA